MSFNPGPWRVSNGGESIKTTHTVVVCDTPVMDVLGANDVSYYGGHLVCESVSSRNAPLIAAAPELLDLCRECLNYASGDLFKRLDDIVFRLTGERVPVITKDHQCKHRSAEHWIDVPGEWVGLPIKCIFGYELRIKPVVDMTCVACPNCSLSVSLVLAHDDKHMSCTECGGWGSIEECTAAFEAIPF